MTGNLRIVTEGTTRDALQEDYAAMPTEAMLLTEALAFDELMGACGDLQGQVNQAAAR